MGKIAVTILLSLSVWGFCLAAGVSAQTAGCEDTVRCELGTGERQEPQLPQEDTSPPRLVSIDVEPDVIDTTSAEQMITVTIVVTDDQFVVWPGFSFQHEDWRPWYPNTLDVVTLMRDIGRVETPDGSRFQWVLTLLPEAAGGKWMLVGLTLSDVKNWVYYEKYRPEYEWPLELNEVYFTNLSGTKASFPYKYDAANVIVRPDAVIGFSDALVDVTAHFTTVFGINVGKEAIIEFAPAGREQPRLTAKFLQSSSTTALSYPDVCGRTPFFDWRLIAGTDKDGVFKSRFWVPADSATGDWVVKSIKINQSNHLPVYFGDCPNCDTHPLIGAVAYRVDRSHGVWLPFTRRYCVKTIPRPECLPRYVAMCAEE